MKRNLAVDIVKPAFQPRTLPEISETFRMVWEDSESEDLAAYQANEKAPAYYKEDISSCVAIATIF